MPAFTSSSAPSIDLTSAGSPPAMTPTTISGGVPKVGGHSAASSTPRRPLVPGADVDQPAAGRNAASTRSMARAISSRAVATAAGHGGVFGADEIDDLEGGGGVDGGAAGVAPFGQARVEVVVSHG